ncbi:transporter suffix domain-containing protein [Paenibacillus roseipurpureus]|uniref:Transporter suffix domain-containing protein n=1 Tax=Paenibacillus roseopurpureus TaxID=2918901 RepID=A0AA96RLE4_9BACL|nr:transporter suffix domain-containing protein [Paenibacillus sp. MBLB1832]WNR43087.1 transporter suffix domain-containing protein [Paenibacillus sp. MBLB1832]
MSIEENHIIAVHAEVHTIKVIDINPDHGMREESAEFRAAKRRLEADGHYQCYICKGTENLQSHHMAGEYKFRTIVDFNLLKEFLLEWDVYGYSRLLRNLPITTVDDIRNQLILCQAHHTGVNYEDGNGAIGVHYLPFPEWIMQKLCLPGCNPIPQKGASMDMGLYFVESLTDEGFVKMVQEKLDYISSAGIIETKRNRNRKYDSKTIASKRLDKKRKERFILGKKLGIGLLILSTIAFLSAFTIPFFVHSGARITGWITGLLIFSEITFWTGGLLLGKEVAKKYRSYLNPRNWTSAKKAQVSQEQAPAPVKQDE